MLRRVRKLSNQWLDFAADDRPRVLIWRLASDEQRMLEGFFALELDERTSEHADLFIPFESAFESPADYGWVLRDELIAQYQHDQEGLRAEGLSAEWVAPEPLPKEGDIGALVRSCSSFAKHHALPRHLVLVLQPRSLGSPQALRQWLLAFALAAPAELRVIALDAPGAPLPEELLEKSKGRVVVCNAELDMPGAYAEVNENAGQRDSPGARFRGLFLQLTAAIGGGELDAALQLSGGLFALALAQKWFHLTVPVHAALGSALAADGRHADAKAQYLTAEQNALRGQAEGAPTDREACKKLRLQSRLGLGSALMSAKEHREAAQVFADTIPLAAESGEDGTRLDCYRLAALCHALAEDPPLAFRWAHDGLLAAKTMSAETLAVSSLPFLGDALLQLCEPAGQKSQHEELEREIERLAGKPDWRPAQPPGPEADAA